MNRMIVKWHVQYRLIRGQYCRKVITKRISPVACRKVHILAQSKRCFQLYGDAKYGTGHFLKITLAYYERQGCKCVRKLKNIFEPCNCAREKRWTWIRQCRPSCHHNCQNNCYKVRAFLTYKLAKEENDDKEQCVPTVLFKHKYKCCEYLARFQGKQLN